MFFMRFVVQLGRFVRRSRMHITIEQPDARRLVARLREGDVDTEVTGWQPEQAAAHLLAALESARRDGYGECLWLEPTGQYWWMLKREDERLEVAVMYSAGVVPGWQHVFRAEDAMSYLQDLVRSELARHQLIDEP
jgi:hypothetical protein